MAYTWRFVEPVIEADNRLRRLRNGIVYHKYNREEVAGNAECRHTVFFQIMNEYKVALTNIMQAIATSHRKADDPSGHI